MRNVLGPLMRSSAGSSAAFALVVALCLLEVVVVSATYKHAIEFSCRDIWPGFVCGGASGAAISIYTALAALSVFPLVKPGALQSVSRHAAFSPRPAALHAIGVAILLVPALRIGLDPEGDHLVETLVFWGAGAFLAGLGAARLIAPPAAWRDLLRAHGRLLAAMVAVGAAAPVLAIQIRAAWWLEDLTAATFRSVHVLVSAVGYRVEADPVLKIIRVDEFGVNVAPVCSGIEGIGLITVFMTFYLYLFRDRIRLPLALVLIPAGWAVSALFNTIRIALLLIIGAEGAPELAVDGFHSHAGWLMFTILSGGFMAAAHLSPWFRKPVGDAATDRPQILDGAPPPFLADWNAARLAPFIVFMATALLTSTFVETPALAYPGRFLATAAALALFHAALRRIDWALDLRAVGAGLLIGALWVVSQPAEPGPDPLSDALSAWPIWAFAIWVICRVLGTAVLVPVVEELLFRSYLVERLDLRDRLGPIWGPMFAVGVSTVLFAALHDRWALAALAGLVFAWFALRRGRIADAICCHASANALIAAYALATGRWTLI